MWYIICRKPFQPERRERKRLKKERKTPESKLLTNARWDRANSKNFGFKCLYKTDQDIIDKLESTPNKNAYIKGLIRADIARQDEPTETD